MSKGDSCSISRGSFRDRKALLINNGTLEVVILSGGGHIAAIRPVGEADLNPLWSPPWASMEPHRFRAKRDSGFYGGAPEGRLLASIMGHNLCLDLFGGPSAAESAAGMGVHGEAPVAAWAPTKMNASARGCRLVMQASLPEARLVVQRAVRVGRSAGMVAIEETVLNQGAWDRPVMWCEHVSLGPPFLDRKRTRFDVSGDIGRTFPAEFDAAQKLKKDASFVWPSAPNARGGASFNLTTMRPSGDYGDFAAVRMNPEQGHAWFTAVRPDLGLIFGYLFRRADFPWLGIWDQAYSRKGAPWNGQSLVRGMEFSTSPFPTSKRQALEMGELEGQPTVRWVPARSQVKARYGMFLVRTEADLSAGVHSIVSDDRGRWRALLGSAGGAEVMLGRLPLGQSSAKS